MGFGMGDGEGEAHQEGGVQDLYLLDGFLALCATDLYYKTHMRPKDQTEAHARKMKVISVGITFMGNISDLQHALRALFL